MSTSLKSGSLGFWMVVCFQNQSHSGPKMHSTIYDCCKINVANVIIPVVVCALKILSISWVVVCSQNQSNPGPVVHKDIYFY